MQDREKVARFIEAQICDQYDSQIEIKERLNLHHYGLLELRDLLDFIYSGKPKTKEEELNNEGRRECINLLYV